MLPAANRLRSADDFRRVFRSGRRRANSYVAIHLMKGDSEAGLKVGFIVSKAVGNAVVRNKVRRRLRHIMREYLNLDAMIVVRAMPAAATASHQELREAIANELEKL